MSKLQNLRQVLETYHEIILIDWEEVINLDGRYHKSVKVGIKSRKNLVHPPLDHNTDFRFHIVKYYISPKDELFKPKELDEFMMSVIPQGLKPTYALTSQSNGEVDNPAFVGLRFGISYFIEKLGERQKFQRDEILLASAFSRLPLTKTDYAMGNSNGFVNGQRIVNGGSIDLERVISIRLFPSEAVGKDILHVHGGEKYKFGGGYSGIRWGALRQDYGVKIK